MHKQTLAAAALLLGMGPAFAQAPAPGPAAAPVPIVAAENFYGDVAAQIAGPDGTVTSILSNPDQDPHLFEASPSTARSLAGARVVIANGVDYDPWMTKLLRASPAPGRTVLVAGDLLKRRPGSNPHIWYDPATMPVVAQALAKALATADPAHAAAFTGREQDFETSLAPLRTKVAAMRAKYAGQTITATEPVFGLMAQALGLKMRNERFQLAVMNGTEPRASDVAAFETDLRQKKVRALLYNSQATGPAAKRLLEIAKASGIPVVGVTETMPAGTHFQDWMLGELNALEAALGT